MDSLKRYGDADEGAQHESSGKHVHVSTFEASDDQSDDCSIEKTPASIGEVDSGLCVVVGETHHTEKDTGIVAQKGVAGKLSEETDEDGDNESTSHTGGADDFEPGLLGGFHLGLDSLPDLHDFGLDELGAGITFGMVLDEDLSGFLLAVFGDEETRRLG